MATVTLREKKLSDGRISLYLDIYQKGRKRERESLNIHLTGNKHADKDLRGLANNILLKRQLEAASTPHGLAPKFKDKVDFIEYMKKVLDDKVKYEALTKGSTTNWTNVINHLNKYTNNKGIQIGAIDETWLEDFRLYLLTSMGQNTVNILFTRLKTTFRKALKEGFIGRNPAENIKNFDTLDTERNFLSIEELQALARTPCDRPQVKIAFLFACYTGLRLSDVRALAWGDIKDGRIHFRQKKTRGFEYLDLNPTAASLLNQCKGANELPLADKPIFNIPDNNHIGSRHLHPWVKAAGITKHISFHCSRHTFATSLLTAGNDLYTTSKLLGHKSITSTAIYAKIVDEKKKTAVNSLIGIEVTA